MAPQRVMTTEERTLVVRALTLLKSKIDPRDPQWDEATRLRAEIMEGRV